VINRPAISLPDTQTAQILRRSGKTTGVPVLFAYPPETQKLHATSEHITMTTYDQAADPLWSFDNFANRRLPTVPKTLLEVHVGRVYHGPETVSFAVDMEQQNVLSLTDKWGKQLALKPHEDGREDVLLFATDGKTYPKVVARVLTLPRDWRSVFKGDGFLRDDVKAKWETIEPVQENEVYIAPKGERSITGVHGRGKSKANFLGADEQARVRDLFAQLDVEKGEKLKNKKRSRS
jgi:hypothetical protein